mgnify:CR=1 FL=1
MAWECRTTATTLRSTRLLRKDAPQFDMSLFTTSTSWQHGVDQRGVQMGVPACFPVRQTGDLERAIDMRRCARTQPDGWRTAARSSSGATRRCDSPRGRCRSPASSSPRRRIRVSVKWPGGEIVGPQLVRQCLAAQPGIDMSKLAAVGRRRGDRLHQGRASRRAGNVTSEGRSSLTPGKPRSSGIWASRPARCGPGMIGAGERRGRCRIRPRPWRRDGGRRSGRRASTPSRPRTTRMGAPLWSSVL